MKLLCIDTSSKLCSVAILDNNTLTCKKELDNGLTHSQNLMPILKQILEENNLTLKDIDLLVCDIGPGSFTGIRIGVATVKAFQDSLNIPAVGVDSLITLSLNVKTQGIICSIIDCKNDNCYYGIYNLEKDTYNTLKSPVADSFENCINELKFKYPNNKITFVGDLNDNFKNIISENINNYAFNPLNSLDIYNLGIIGLDLYKQKKVPDNILPLYLKKPQAQRQLEIKNINIRQMKIEDTKNFDLTQFDDFWNFENLKSELSSENSKFVVATIDEEIVGFAGIKTVLDEACIMNIAVKKSFRRQGIAKLLLNSIENICTKNSIKSLNLEVNENNFAAINLYKKTGFHTIGKRPKYYDNKDDAILMEKLY